MTHPNDSITCVIELTQGLVAIVDAEDSERVSRYRWYPRRDNRTIYAFTLDGSTNPPRTVQLHRFLLDAPDEFHVDHINHDGLDNRKANLRITTFTENQQSRRPRIGREGLKGVCWVKRQKKWRARIKANGKEYHLGSFDTAEEAAAAYDEAAVRFHGEFAVLNRDAA